MYISCVIILIKNNIMIKTVFQLGKIFLSERRMKLKQRVFVTKKKTKQTKQEKQNQSTVKKKIRHIKTRTAN